MAYDLPTPAELKLHFPAFAAVDDAVVQYNITAAARSVDQSWAEGDYTRAVELYACHLLTLAGFGTGADAQANAQGLAGFSMIRSGQLTLQKAATSGSSDDGVPPQYAGSTYGRQFWWLLRQNRPGASVTGGAVAAYPDGMYPPLGSPARFGF
jgi:hypothetical protein